MKKVFSCALASLFVAGCADPEAVLEQPIAVPGPTLEEQVGQKFEAARGNSTEVRELLAAMPKGADLHSHLSGAVPTESLIEWGADDGLCIDTSTFAAVMGPCDKDAGKPPLSAALTDPVLHDSVLQAWSMQGHDGPMLSRHGHFFDAFGRFALALGPSRLDDAVAEAMSAAAGNNQIYIELMLSVSSNMVGEIASKYMKDSDEWTEDYLLDKRAKIMADPVFSATIQSAKAAVPEWISGARKILKCDTASPDAGCGVEVRFLVSASRTQDRGYVFAQWVYGFELAQVAPLVVGINLVAPEEHESSLKYYDDEMTALGVLRRFNESDVARFPVHISLHAGELINEVLPPTAEGQEHLTYHIRRAVDVAGAERVGHAVDIAHESDGAGTIDLLDTMRKKGVMVESCLSSNDALLGVSGVRHPLQTYLKQAVPVALATDAQGVLRTSILDDYVRAFELQGVDYRRLKTMVRTSLEHGFLAGSSLWVVPDSFYTIVDNCLYDSPTTPVEELSVSCSTFLGSNERAALQWKLEAGFMMYESTVASYP